MNKKGTYSFLLILLFVFMNAFITLSWVEKSIVPFIPEEIKEQSGSEEETCYAMDFFYAICKNTSDWVSIPLWKTQKISTSTQNNLADSFIPDHYSPPEV